MDIKKCLRDHYDIHALEYAEVEGGWSAAAYRIETTIGPLFLKRYDKKRPSTHRLTRNLERIYAFLSELSLDALILPRTTTSQKHMAEDDASVYVLFDYVHGEAYAMSDILQELAWTLARLHETKVMDARLPVDELGSMHRISTINHQGPYQDILHDNLKIIEDAEKLLETLSLRLSNQKRVVTHGDIHSGNILVNSHCKLIDFENVSISLPEIDFIFLSDMPHFEKFMTYYKQQRPSYQMNPNALAYCRLRRQLTDIYEVCDDNNVDDDSVNQNKQYLFDNIRVIKEIIKKENIS